MLVSLAVGNFLSFAREQTLSLIARGRLDPAHEAHALPIPDSEEKVLRVALLYGPNGSGKSNFLAALRYVRHIALGGTEGRSVSRSPFRLAQMRGQPSTFDLLFIASGNLYRFSICVNDDSITKEQLAHVVGSKERPIYERITHADGRIEIDAPELKEAGELLRAVVTLGGRQDQSFLATVRAGLQPSDYGEHLGAAIEWLSDSLIAIGSETAPDLLDHAFATDPEFSHVAAAFLNSSSIAVAPSQYANKEALLELAKESDGTRRLVELLPALHTSKANSAVYAIDEINRSLHPLLLYKLLEYFLRTEPDAPSQIIATTHESHLLNLDLLRRDEIWLAQKDTSGATELHSLTEFNVRKDFHIEKGYLDGRFGAVPRLGAVDGLITRYHQRSAEANPLLGMTRYSVSGAARAPLIDFMATALESSGCRILSYPDASSAPFVLTFEKGLGERSGVVAYAFLATRTPTMNRPSDERSFQIKYGSKTSDNTHHLWIDPNGLYTTLLLGIDPEEDYFVALDPAVHNPTKFFIRIEFNDAHVRKIRSNGWYAWERAKRSASSNEPTEVLVGGTKSHFLDLIRFERQALNLAPRERKQLAEQVRSRP